MATFPEAHARLFHNVYVCRKCETKNRFPVSKFLSGKASCRKCSSRHLRVVRMRAKK